MKNKKTGQIQKTIRFDKKLKFIAYIHGAKARQKLNALSSKTPFI